MLDFAQMRIYNWYKMRFKAHKLQVQSKVGLFYYLKFMSLKWNS